MMGRTHKDISKKLDAARVLNERMKERRQQP
jgi:hypothetical protein